MAEIQPILSFSNTQNPKPRQLTGMPQSGSIWTTLSLNQAIKFLMSRLQSDEERMKEAQNELKKSIQGTI